MATETELKLRIAPEHLARLKRHALFRTHQLAAPVTHRLHNIYYDTPELYLHHNRMALRLRRVAGKWLQTLKGGGSVKAGLHQRSEWEVAVPSAKLDFSGLDSHVWDEHLPLSIREQLNPVFVTDFYRTSRMLNWQGAIIEVCMDHGEVKSGQHSSPISEVELELKSGQPKQLFQLAQAILDIVPFELEGVSKAEMGFRLLSGYIAGPVKGALPGIDNSQSMIDGLQTLIWSCLSHLQGNLRGAMGSMQEHDAEYLHQMRVALRRVRVALRLAGIIHADEELAALREALAILGSTLGRIREWDVFISHTVIPADNLIEGDTGKQNMQELLASCEGQRADSYVCLRAQARELQSLLLRFAIWMNGPFWYDAERVAPKKRDFAKRNLQKLYQRYLKAGRNLHELDARQLHALRIQSKKLRYSADFFAPLYDRHKSTDFLCALSEVQELLGEINDIAVAHRLLDELAANQPMYCEVIAFIRSSVDADLSFKLKKLRNRTKDFDEHLIFWNK